MLVEIDKGFFEKTIIRKQIYIRIVKKAKSGIGKGQLSGETIQFCSFSSL